MLPKWYRPPSYSPIATDTIDMVARMTGVSKADILGRSRKPHICRARWAAMRALKQRGLSASHIGRLMGRDHTTVLHGLAQ